VEDASLRQVWLKAEAAAEGSGGRKGGRSTRFKKGAKLVGQCESAFLRNGTGKEPLQVFILL